MVSAVSSKSEDWRLMVRSASPTWVSVFCWPKIRLALFSARSISVLISLTSSCRPLLSAFTPSSESPAARARTLRARTPALSFTSAKAGAAPVMAMETDLASRCDCIRAWPVAASCWLELLASRSIHAAVTTSTRTEPPSKVNKVR